MRKAGWLFGLITAGMLAAADCNTPASLTVALPGHPFTAVPSRDGCWIFVSLPDREAGNIAVLHRGAGRVAVARVVPAPAAPTGIVLTHDGKLLIAAARDRVLFLDVQRLTSSAPNPIVGSISTGLGSGNIYANVTADDKLLFVSREAAADVAVIDLERARRTGYQEDAILGKIPTGGAPIALTFSPDGKWLYSTSEGALPAWKWPIACKAEARPAGSSPTRPEGAVIVVDVERARSDPAGAVAARVPSGCSPVRMAISPSGDRIYVTARNSNAVLVFDTAKLLPDPEHARVATAAVGAAPVPVAVVDKGKRLVVGNSNRFGGGAEQTLTILDAAKMAVLGAVTTGAFPRELRVSEDGRTLFLTNFGSDSLQVIDVRELPDSR